MRYLVLLMVLMGAAPAGAQRLMVYGDSLSAGYMLSAPDAFYAQLERALRQSGYPDAQVVNASVSGHTTADGVRRLPEALRQKPDGVLLELGANDGLRELPLMEAQRNLETIIQAFRKNGIPVLLVGMRIPPRGDGYDAAFEKMYRDLARKHDLMLYPFFLNGAIWTTWLPANAMNGKMMDDGMHPTASGVAAMVKNILPDVRVFLEKNVQPSSK
ncbi:MAG: arylesterase [Alphaproteobacteria bacterium]|nr:arylesterase [Alphaproteobacteria bacterium]